MGIGRGKARALESARAVVITLGALMLTACGGGGGGDEGAPEGELQRVIPFGDTSDDAGIAVAVAPDDSFVVVGEYAGTITLGAGEPGETTLTSVGGSRDLFVARYAADTSLLGAKTLASPSLPGMDDVALFPDGSFVICGDIQSALTFEVGEPDEVTLNSVGTFDGFLARYDASGDLVWARRDGGAGAALYRSVATFPDGSFVTSGFTGGTTTFGEGDPNEVTIPDTGGGDIFTARYNADGSLAWVRTVGSTNQDRGQGVTSFPGGTCVTTGFFQDTVTFGTGEPTQTVLTAEGNIDAFLARYDSSGNLLWARRAGSTGYDNGTGLVALSDGSVVWSGYFQETATFAPGLPSQRTLVSDGGEDAFLARFDGAGACLWAVRAGGTGGERFNDVALLADGARVVTTGSLGDAAVFGPGEANEVTIESGGSSDAGVAGYDLEGRFQWVRTGGGTSNDVGNGAGAGTSRVVMTGTFRSVATFDPGRQGETTVVAVDATDGFLAAYIWE